MEYGLNGIRNVDYKYHGLQHVIKVTLQSEQVDVDHHSSQDIHDTVATSKCNIAN